jgi:hypothetical protein
VLSLKKTWDSVTFLGKCRNGIKDEILNVDQYVGLEKTKVPLK